MCVWLCACACVLLGDEREELYKSLSHQVLCKNGCQMILRNSTCDKGILGDKVSFPHTLTHLGEQNTYRHTHLLTCISNRQHPSGFSRDLEVYSEHIDLQGSLNSFPSTELFPYRPCKPQRNYLYLLRDPSPPCPPTPARVTTASTPQSLSPLLTGHVHC